MSSGRYPTYALSCCPNLLSTKAALDFHVAHSSPSRDDGIVSDFRSDDPSTATQIASYSPVVSSIISLIDSYWRSKSNPTLGIPLRCAILLSSHYSSSTAGIGIGIKVPGGLAILKLSRTSVEKAYTLGELSSTVVTLLQ
jgi:hypothetical protein